MAAKKRKRRAPKVKAAPAVNTAEKLRGRPFKAGDEWDGNPNGRPKGARNRFCSAMLDDYAKLWREGGQDALRKVRDEDPVAFVKAALHWVPREFDLGEQTQAGFRELWQAVAAGGFLPSTGEGEPE